VQNGSAAQRNARNAAAADARTVRNVQAQRIVPDGDWDAFMASARTTLPACIRINGSGKFAEAIREELRNNFVAAIAGLSPEEADGETITPPFALPWCAAALQGVAKALRRGIQRSRRCLERPNPFAVPSSPQVSRRAGVAGQLQPRAGAPWCCGRASPTWPDSLHVPPLRPQLRKLPLLAGLHEWLKNANESGSITRQEAVSMIPPLLLGVQPQHRVLDMCAAPGSKTSQLLEALHSAPGGAQPAGFVIANDADLKRCNLLTHQTKRAGSAGLLVTNHDASSFPDLRDGGDAGGPLRFDRVLADVPCSGDGTVRKAPDIWQKWSVGGGAGLHPLQLRIAQRAARLLAVGGQMVYSTCSLNPVENEAVVAALLRWGAGALVLDDCSAELPGLKRLPGLRTWQVWDRDGPRQPPSAGDDATADAAAAEGKRALKPLRLSLFPDAASDAMPLERCVRVLPHLADTGGFFIARLTKVRNLGAPPVAEAEAEAAAEAAEAAPPAAPAAAPAKAAHPPRFLHVDPVVPVTDETVLGDVERHYGLDAALALRTQCVTRTSAFETNKRSEAASEGVPAPPVSMQPRRLYLVTEHAAALLRAPGSSRLKFLAAGLKIMERGQDEATVVASGNCAYRLSQEGLRAVLPHATRQRVQLPLRDFVRLVRDRTLYFAKADHDRPQPSFEPEAAAAITPLASGCCILVPRMGDAAAAAAPTAPSAEDLAIVAWKGKVSLALLVAKPEAAQMLTQLYKLLPDMAPAALAAAAAAVEEAPVVKTE
jgi:16S rRNA C967 or C1407 C5-methylase (RsmB/RsmF family)